MKIIVFFVLLVLIYCTAASIGENAMSISDFYLSDFDKQQTEILFKFFWLAGLAFFIDFKKKPNKNN